MALIDKLTAIANAIRGKTGKTTELTLEQMATEIAGIETGGNYQAKTATPSTSAQTIKPDSGYDALSQVTVNAMPTATQATPSISVSSAGLITASATQSAGYVASGTKSATKQLTAQEAKTVTPGTSDQTAVASGVYTTGAITVKGDANLKAANIAKGVSIFGVTGSLEGAKVAMGTFEITAGGTIKNKPVTISGLSFQPKKVMFLLTAGAYEDGVLGGFREEGASNNATYLHYYIEDGDYYVGNMEASEEFTITPTSNGFTIASTSSTLRWPDYVTYTYVVIG